MSRRFFLRGMVALCFLTGCGWIDVEHISGYERRDSETVTGDAPTEKDTQTADTNATETVPTDDVDTQSGPDSNGATESDSATENDSSSPSDSATESDSPTVADGDSGSDSTDDTTPVSVTLTISASGHGTVTPNGAQMVQDGATVALMAIADIGYSFEYWMQTAGTGTVVFDNTNAAAARVTITGDDAEITAFFGYDSWAHNEILTMDTTPNGADVPGDVNTFPVLVRLDAARFPFFEAQSNGDDIRFSAADGSSLNYEIERWDRPEEVAEIWVWVPTVFGNGITELVMHWGRDGVVSKSDGARVFDANGYFVSVWHLRNLNDATANANGLFQSVADRPIHQSTLIGDGIRFDAGEWLGAPANASLGGATGFSISMWVRTIQTQAQELLSQRDIATGDAGSYRLMMQADGTVLFDVFNTGWQWGLQLVSTQAINDGNWHHVFAIRSGTSDAGWIYIDGVHNGFNAGVGQLLDNNIRVVLGKNILDDTNVFIGEMDEVRIQSEGFFEAWLKLCYENQRAEDYLFNSRL
ncbi:MAG: DUF2341 domain-containing protein [Deltaproteobacteria bacterium]|nr:DUF2341 domain-containing protein [Deltaproteobacteria bacterium]